MISELKRQFKRIINNTVGRALLGLKVDKLIRQSSRPSVLNITYHGVVDRNSTWFSPRHISKDQFEKHLIYYKSNFQIISLEEAFAFINGEFKLSKNAITISFDDGFLNNYTTVLPLIEKHHIHATFFVSSVICGLDLPCLWPEIMAVYKLNFGDQPINLTGLGKQFEDKILSYSELCELIKVLPFDERDIFLNNFVNKYDLVNKLALIPAEFWKLMSQNELVLLSKSKYVCIGSHGHAHYNLGNIDPAPAKFELENSKYLLEKLTNKKVDLIAYPDGSYNDNVKQIAKEIGYNGQLAVNYLHPNDNLDSMIMNRHSISSTIPFEHNILRLNYVFNALSCKNILL